LTVTRTCISLKNVTIQNQIHDIDVNGFGRAVACGLQNHTGPEHAPAPAAAHLGKERYSPIDFYAIDRIRRAGNTGNIATRQDNFCGGDRNAKAGIKGEITESSDLFDGCT
jgi:hypothetical protein